jgi:CheY-like chemotaxis protein
MCPPRVILLEDDDFVRRSEEQLLGEWGATLIASGASVEEVLAAASASAMSPDAIVSDYDLGTETGTQAIIRIRDKYQACIPALVITGRFEDAAASLNGLQNVTVFVKPLRPARLRQALTRAISS